MKNWKIIVAACSVGALIFAGIARAEQGRDIIPVKLKKPDGSVQTTALYKSSRALLIGVSDYTAGWPDLESIPSELDQVEGLLKSQGFLAEKHLNPDARQLKRLFEDFIVRYGYDVDARLLFFFAGHGHTRKDGAKGYLVPADAPSPLRDEKGFLKMALPMSQILAWSRQMEAKHALFLFDSCFSGTVFKARDLPKTPPAITEMTAKPVRQFITAGGAGESVPARSVFTPVFVDALRYGKGDLDGDGYVSGTELGMHLQSVVPNYARQFPQFGKIQDYELSRGDFVFLLAGGDAVVNRPAPNTVATLSVESQVAGARVLLDGRVVGTTNMADKTVTPGRHTVRVEKPGYEPYEKSLDIERGRSISLFVDLTEKRAPVPAVVDSKGRLYVDTDPDDALVRILNIGPRFYDGIELDPGRYHLEISATGHKTKDFWIDLDAGEDKRVDIALEPSGGGHGAVSDARFRNSLGMEFVYIPPGSFMMGSPQDEPEREDNEKLHRVTLTRGFHMQTTEVTVGQWRAFARETGYRTQAEREDGAYGWTGEKWEKDGKYNWKNPGFSQGENDPVTCVSWNDARKFVEWISRKEGKSYALPTEAQWEYAARAGTTTPFSFGKCLPTSQANYRGVAPMPGCPKGDYRNKTVPAGSLASNAWGLHDMHGNVLEWCEDWYGDYPGGAVTDPVGPDSGSRRVLRGGSWFCIAYYCRSALRNTSYPGYRDASYGFRLALPGLVR